MPALAAPLLAALLAAGAPPPCTLAHPEDWREYRSGPVVLDTDASRPAALALLREIELVRALVLQAILGEQVEAAGTLRVVAPADPALFEQLAGKGVDGYYKSVPFDGALVVLGYDGSRPLPEILAHELAHLVSWQRYIQQPTWFAEGLAQHVQTVSTPRQAEPAPTGSRPALGIQVRGLHGTGGRFAGLVTRARLAEAAQATPVPARELLAWTGEEHQGQPSRFHVAAWRLYHFLSSRRPAAFADLRARLARGEPPAAAWLAAFPGYDPSRPEEMADLDEAVARYVSDGDYPSIRVEVAAPDPRPVVTSPSRAELHLLLLEARRLPAPGQPALAALTQATVEEALREDPGHPVALWLQRKARPEGVVDRLRAAVAARPDDWRGAWLLAGLLRAEADRPEKEVLLRRAIALAPDAPSPRNALAWLLLAAGRAEEARPFAARALDLSPWHPGHVETLAVVASELGQCAEALRLVQRAADLVGGDEADTQALRDRAIEIGTRCVPRASPAR